MSEGFTREGPLASPRVNALVPKIVSFLRSLGEDDMVVFASDAHAENDPEFRRFPPHCIRGTKQAEVRRELIDAAETAGAKIEFVEKQAFTAFLNPRMEKIVRDAATDEWVVIGCVTDCCIEANVADLVQRGKRATVLRDLVETWDTPPAVAEQLGLPESQVHSADTINAYWFKQRLPAIWGATVMTSAALMAERRTPHAATT